MDVFSLLKFWRNTGAGDFDSTIDDEESFFDLVLTNSGDENVFDYGSSPKLAGINSGVDDSKSSFRFAPHCDVYLNNKRKIVHLDSPNRKTPHSPLRLWMLGFQNNQKPKSEKETRSEINEISEIEEVKIGELLRRDNSLRCKLRTEKLLEKEQTPSKRFSKDLVNKYLNLIKVSKRSSEKSRLSEKSVTPSSSPASTVFSPRKEEKKSGGRGTVLREVRKHLGKSRSASAILQTPVARSDDSAVQQQDGIQGAILHCKRSFNSPSQGCVLSRSGSAPSNNEGGVWIEEEKRSSI